MDELTRELNRSDQSQTFKCFHFTRISEFIGKITNSDWSIFSHFNWSIFSEPGPRIAYGIAYERDDLLRRNSLRSHGNVKHAEYMLINKPIHTPLIHHPYRLPLRIDYQLPAPDLNLLGDKDFFLGPRVKSVKTGVKYYRRGV